MIAEIFHWLWLSTQVVLAPPGPTIRITWSTDLGLTSLEAIDRTLVRPMDDQNAWEVTVEHGTKRQIRNCRDFLAVAKSSFDVQTEDDWSTLQAAGARCLALDALRSAKAASRTFLGWFTLSPESIARLPPSLDMPDAPESVEDAERAERACKPWGRYDHTLKVEVETGDRALLHTAGWSGRLTLYARADFNGDGIEDLMVRRDAHVDHGGTAADSTVFIVTQTSPRRCLHLVRALGARR